MDIARGDWEMGSYESDATNIEGTCSQKTQSVQIKFLQGGGAESVWGGAIFSGILRSYFARGKFRICLSRSLYLRNRGRHCQGDITPRFLTAGGPAVKNAPKGNRMFLNGLCDSILDFILAAGIYFISVTSGKWLQPHNRNEVLTLRQFPKRARAFPTRKEMLGRRQQRSISGRFGEMAANDNQFRRGIRNPPRDIITRREQKVRFREQKRLL